ncbi:MAG: transcriptional regulator [Bacteroidales bacterium]
MNKPKVTISLKPYLADFCRHEFRELKDGSILIRRRHDIGKMIFSQVNASPVPVKKRPVMEDAATFTLPISSESDLLGKFLYVDRWGQEKIQEFIQAKFNLRAEHFFQRGYKKGYSQKRIVEAFLCGYNIRNNALSYEAVKKNDYRKRQREIREISKELKNAD